MIFREINIDNSAAQDNKMKTTDNTSRVNNSDDKGKEKAGRWTIDEHEKFLNGLTLYGKDWRGISKLIKTRTVTQGRVSHKSLLLIFL